MTKREINQKMRRKRIEKLIVIAILAIFMIAVYRFVFLTKTNPVDPTVTAIVKEVGAERSPLTTNLTINEDENGEYYIIIPEKVKSYLVSKFVRDDEDDTTSNTQSNTISDENIIQTSTSPVAEENTNTLELTENTIESDEIQENTISNIIANEISETQNTTEENVIQSETENIVQNTIEEDNTITNIVNEVAENAVEEISDKEDTEETSNSVIVEDFRDNKDNEIGEVINTNPNEFLPNSRYYLTEEEYEKKAVNFDVIYVTKTNYTSDGSIIQLYSQELEHIIAQNGTDIIIKGNLPYGATIDTKEVKSDIERYIEGDSDYEGKTLLMAYDVSILDDSGFEFQPKSCMIPESVDVKISSEAELSGKIQGNVISIKHFVLKNIPNEDTGEEELTLVEEDIEGIKKEENSLEFSTDEFSPYAIFSENAFGEDVIIVDDYDADRNYLIGLNYTENGTGRATNDFYKVGTNLAKATINYYSFDYLKEPKPIELNFDTANWTSSNTTNQTISENIMTIGYNEINWVALNDRTSWQDPVQPWITYDAQTVRLSFTTDLTVDMVGCPWQIEITAPNGGSGIDIAEMQNRNAANIAMVGTNPNIRISGDNMQNYGWTKNGNTYSFDLVFVCYYGAIGAAIQKGGNFAWELTKVDLVYESQVTVVVTSDNTLDLEKEWTLDFDIPNSANFKTDSFGKLNTGKYTTQTYSNGHLSIEGDALQAQGWVYNSTNNTYTYTFKIHYFTDNRISSLPDNFNFSAINNNEVVGYISGDSDERQILMRYIKCVPITGNGNISIELIDNPYMDRPIGKGFDGWTSHESYSFSLNSITKVQTLSTTVNMATKEIEINLYPDWKDANIVFVSKAQGSSDNNNTGRSPSSPFNTFSKAKSVLENSSNYLTAANASSRELNIIVVMNGTFTADGNTTGSSFNINSSGAKAYTLTSLYNGIDYRNTAKLNFNTTITAYNDLQYDFLNIYGSSYTFNEGDTNVTNTLIGNTYNVRIGRGVIPYTQDSSGSILQLQGGPTSSTLRRQYRFVVESGYYGNVMLGRAYYGTNYTSSGVLIAGNDVDRIKQDNNTFKVFTRIAPKCSACDITGDTGKPAFYMVVKSGTIGMDTFAHRNGGAYSGEIAYCGIYTGGLNNTTRDRSDRYLIVEGGNISNIVGGLATGTSYSQAVKTFTYVKGGTLQNINGGAGIATTYGDRIIQVTGGKIAYSVAGGSNGYLANGSNGRTGRLDGNTLVYIGGDAEIGTAGSDSLYYANAGSVFGAGYGNSSINTSGQINNTHVIIDGEAKIHNNVYGGGNYGVVGTATSLPSSADIEYALSTPTIVNNGLTNVEFIISRNTSTTNGYALRATSTTSERYSYTTNALPDEYTRWMLVSAGNGKYYIKNAAGGYLRCTNNQIRTSTNPETEFTLTIAANGTGTLMGYRYNNTNYYLRYSNGFGITTSNTSYLYFLTYRVLSGDDPPDVTTCAVVDILGGTIEKSVFGGANNNGGVTNAKNIGGSVEVNVKNGTIIEAVYGGCNTAGTIFGATKVTITGGTIGTVSQDSDAVFGGGRGQNTDTKQRALVTIQDDDNNITINGNMYAGSALGSISANSYIYLRDIGSHTILCTGDVYGGGKGQENSTVAMSKGNVTVTIDGGTFSNMKVFGGANLNGTIDGNALVKIGENNNTLVNEVYGGGNRSNITSATDSDKVYIYQNGTVNNAFNGGNRAGIAAGVTVGIYLQGGTVQQSIYGGSNTSGSVDHTYVELSQSATAQNVYGGGKGNSTSIADDTEVVIKGASTVSQNVYGGGEGTGLVTTGAVVYGDTSVEISESSQISGNVYGGGNNGPTFGTSNVEIDNSTVSGSTFGAGKGSTANVRTNSNIDILNNAIIAENVYGGGDAGPLVGTSTVSISESTVSGSAFGGGKGSSAVVGANSNIYVEETSLIGDCLYGGGDQGQVSGSTVVTVSESTITNDIYGGGNRAEVTQNTSVSMTVGSTAVTLFGGGNAGIVGGNTTVSVDSSSISDALYGGGNEGAVTGNTGVLCTDSTITNAIFGGGKSANVGSAVVTITNTTTPQTYTTKHVYGGGDQGELTGSTNVTISNTRIEYEIYGGGNGASVQTGTTVPGKVAGNTSVRLDDSFAMNVFGGGNGTTALVGGNTSVILEDSSVVVNENEDISGHVFGGGNNGPVSGSSKVGLINATIGDCAYAAGNGETAVVRMNPYIYAEGTTTIENSLFGGGNAAKTGDVSIPTPTNDDEHPYESNYITAIVDIAGATIGGNVYGGANSSVIQGNTVVNIGAKAIDEFYHSSTGTAFASNNKTFLDNKIEIGGTVFGGGESMDPTTTFNYNTVSVLGNINININGEDYDQDEIIIHKSVFGSGNASRATGRKKVINIKNYGTLDRPKQGVSLQRATDVIVNNSALWLSGTTDSTSLHPEGYYTLNQIHELKLKNNGVLYLRNTSNKVVTFTSVVDNPTTGQEELATVEIIDKVTGTNGNIYYAKNNKIYNTEGTEVIYILKDGKIVDVNTSETITEISDIAYADTLNKNVDNRLYMYSGINLNVSDSEDANDDYGDVNGMTFFGLYRSISADDSGEESGEGEGEGSGEGSGGEGNGAGTEFNDNTSDYDLDLYKGMFDEEYIPGGNLSWVDRNYNRSYVLGNHKKHPEQDITKDGFYTVYEKLDGELEEGETLTEQNFYNFNPTTYTSYITPTPSNDVYYMWFAGPDQAVYYFPLTIVASKHSTLGTKELLLKGLSFPNAKLTMQSVETDFIDGVGLYSKNTVPNINLDPDDVNKRFGMTMKTGNSGWSMVGSTDLFYDPTSHQSSYSGTELYKIENSSTTPTLSFYLYHSNNITIAQDIGYCTVKMRLEYRKDAFNRGFADVIIDMFLKTELYNDKGYNGAITPGVQYDLFATTTTNITNKSSFSTYFELAEPNFYTNELVEDFYEDSYRLLTTDYLLPEDTTITMIDRYDNSNPKYYYYVVTAADVANGKREFRFSDFTMMGSTNDKYDDKRERRNYYYDTIDYEYENFIFITDFKNAKFTDTADEEHLIVDEQKIGICLRADVDDRQKVIFELLHDQIDDMVYGIYDTHSTIDIESELTKTKIYIGNEVYLNVDTLYDITVTGGSRVYDTRFFDKKLGLKLTLYMQSQEGYWVSVPGSELLGLYFELDGIKYFPSEYGITRIKIAELVSNATSSIKIGTENSNLKTGHYKIKIESFGSADGMYYGVEASDTDEVVIDIVKGEYGIDATIQSWQAIIDTTTGKVLDNSNNRVGYIAPEEHKLNFRVEYRSRLTNPYITVSLYRRTYEGVYDNTYEKVDLSDYITNELEVPFEIDRSQYVDSTDLDFLDEIQQFHDEYTAWDTETIRENEAPEDPEHLFPTTVFNDLEFTLKNELTTGTYKIEFKLYDTYQDQATNIVEENGTNTARTYNYLNYEYIGETYVYIIIK